MNRITFFFLNLDYLRHHHHRHHEQHCLLKPVHLQEVRRFECFSIGSITTALRLRYDTARHIRFVINFLWLIVPYCQYIKVYSVAGRMLGER